MATVIRFSAILGVLLVSLKMTLVWNDNKIHTIEDKARDAMNRVIDEATRKRREWAEQNERVAFMAEAFARATRAFLYTTEIIVTTYKMIAPCGAKWARRQPLFIGGQLANDMPEETAIRGLFQHL